MRSRCELCNTDQEVRYEATRYKLRDGYYFESGARCVDRGACRRRVEATGNAWLVIDPDDRYADPASSLPDLSLRREDA